MALCYSNSLLMAGFKDNPNTLLWFEKSLQKNMRNKKTRFISVASLILFSCCFYFLHSPFSHILSVLYLFPLPPSFQFFSLLFPPCFPLLMLSFLNIFLTWNLSPSVVTLNNYFIVPTPFYCCSSLSVLLSTLHILHFTISFLIHTFCNVW